jgi:hypothetical protein
MVTRLAISLSLVLVAGCYDLERLDPGPKSSVLPIDDFEDGDPIPNASFDTWWKALPFNWGQNPPPVPSVAPPGFESNYALRGTFEWHYPLNHDFTGVSLGVSDARPHLDVNRYRALHVSARFDPGASEFNGTTRFYADLGCESVPTSGNVTGAYVTQLMDEMSNDWQSFVLELPGFQEPTSDPPHIVGGARTCLADLDGIRFTVGTNLEAGDVVSGTLYIDDVYFE